MSGGDERRVQSGVTAHAGARCLETLLKGHTAATQTKTKTAVRFEDGRNCVLLWELLVGMTGFEPATP